MRPHPVALFRCRLDGHGGVGTLLLHVVKYGVRRATVFLSTRQRSTSVLSNVDRLGAATPPVLPRCSPSTHRHNPIQSHTQGHAGHHSAHTGRYEHTDVEYKPTRTERPDQQATALYYSTATTYQNRASNNTAEDSTARVAIRTNVARTAYACGRACICAKAGASIICRFGGF